MREHDEILTDDDVETHQRFLNCIKKIILEGPETEDLVSAGYSPDLQAAYDALIERGYPDPCTAICLKTIDFFHIQGVLSPEVEQELNASYVRLLELYATHDSGPELKEKLETIFTPTPEMMASLNLTDQDLLRATVAIRGMQRIFASIEKMCTDCGMYSLYPML